MHHKLLSDGSQNYSCSVSDVVETGRNGQSTRRRYLLRFSKDKTHLISLVCSTKREKRTKSRNPRYIFTRVHSTPTSFFSFFFLGGRHFKYKTDPGVLDQANQVTARYRDMLNADNSFLLQLFTKLHYAKNNWNVLAHANNSTRSNLQIRKVRNQKS